MLGAGYQGGEVTPLFVIGATLGATLSPILGMPIVLSAALGLKEIAKILIGKLMILDIKDFFEYDIYKLTEKYSFKNIKNIFIKN